MATTRTINLNSRSLRVDSMVRPSSLSRAVHLHLDAAVYTVTLHASWGCQRPPSRCLSVDATTPSPASPSASGEDAARGAGNAFSGSPLSTPSPPQPTRLAWLPTEPS